MIVPIRIISADSCEHSSIRRTCKQSNDSCIKQAMQKIITSRISISSTGFFLCDIQEKFRHLIHACPSVIQTADKMIKASDILGIPLIVTEQNPAKLGSTVRELDISKAAMIEQKNIFSMLTPSVLEKMASLQLDSAVLFGIESHVCVTQTALDLMDCGIKTYLIADGISSMNSVERKIAIDRLRTAGVIVTTSDSILFELIKGSDHAKFKSISKLVKECMIKTREGLDILN